MQRKWMGLIWVSENIIRYRGFAVCQLLFGTIVKVFYTRSIPCR